MKIPSQPGWLGAGCALAGRCRLQEILHEAVDAFHDVLGRYTLEDLLVHPRPASSFLPWPTKQPAKRAP